jgi:transposase-like protein
MNINHQSKGTMTAVNADAGLPEAPATDVEVVPRAKRRTFSRAEKRRILAELDRCSQPGERGAVLRREGVYSSSIVTWRRQQDAADLAALAPQKRGPKPDLHRADAQKIAQLVRDNERLQGKLDKAMLIIDVQKKVSALLGLSMPDDTPGSS